MIGPTLDCAHTLHSVELGEKPRRHGRRLTTHAPTAACTPTGTDNGTEGGAIATGVGYDMPFIMLDGGHAEEPPIGN